MLFLLQLLLIFLFSNSPGQAQVIIGNIPDGSTYQHIASTTFTNDETLILSVYAAATGSVELCFAKTIRSGPNSRWQNDKVVSINFNQKTREITTAGDNILDYGVIPIASASNLVWNRLFITFKYTATDDDYRSYIVLRNSTPDAELLVNKHSVWFDGIQLEKAALPGQTRPTSYHPTAKFFSPNAALSLDGQTRYFEW